MADLLGGPRLPNYRNMFAKHLVLNLMKGYRYTLAPAEPWPSDRPRLGASIGLTLHINGCRLIPSSAAL
jgi:hypothetical protein